MDTIYSNQNKIYNIPHYRNIIDNKDISNYKKDRGKLFTSLESDFNEKFSLLSHKYNKPSLKLNVENNDFNTKPLKNLNLNRNCCYCDCHTKDYSLNIPEYQCDYYFYKKPIFMEYRQNNSLENKINDLKNNLQNFENKLNRTKIDKRASDFYIKKLEKNLSNNNINHPFNFKKENKIRDNNLNASKLNKSSIIFNSFLDKKNRINQKLKINEDFSFNNNNKDYNNIIQTQKEWLDTLHQNHMKTKNLLDIDNYLNNYNNKNNYNNINNYNYKNVIHKCKSYTKNNSIPKSNITNYNYDYDYDTNISCNNNNNNERLYEKYNTKNFSEYQVNSNMDKEKEFYQKPQFNTLKNQFINNDVSNYIYNPELIIPNNRIQSDLINNLIKENDNKNKTYTLNNSTNNKEIKTFNNNSIKENYLILDNKGNQMYKNGKKIVGMKIKYKDNKKNHFINLETVIITGPDGQPKSLELKPIFLDNNKPLVNEENKPFLGINNLYFIDENGNPIVGENEILNEKKQIIQGQLGIVPRDKRGNVIKISLINDNNKECEVNSNKKKLTNSVDDKNIKQKMKQKYYPELIKSEKYFNQDLFKNRKKFKKQKYIKNNKFNNQKLLASSCFACNAGCGISRTGYSSMTYSPFNTRVKRKEETSLKNGTKYGQYYKYKN